MDEQLKSEVEFEKDVSIEELKSEEFLNKIKEFTKKYEYEYNEKLELYNDEEDDIYNIELTNENILKAYDDFRLSARELIIAKRLRETFLFREEELIATISKMKDRLDAYDKDYAECNGDFKELGKKYKNEELNEMSIIRSQSIPMYMVELETVVTAIKDNKSNIVDAAYRLFSSTRFLMRK